MAYIKNAGITIGSKHTYRDYGMHMLSIDVGMPELKTHIIELPGVSGDLDASEIFGSILYGRREIVAVFEIEDKDYTGHMKKIEQIANDLHGKQFRIILDFDPDYYYLGRITAEPEKDNTQYSEMTLTISCQPYKIPLHPFTKTITLAGDTQTITLTGTAKPEAPVVETSQSNITVEMNGTTQRLLKGKTTLSSCIPARGEQCSFKFTGTGTVTLTYTGGLL